MANLIKLDEKNELKVEKIVYNYLNPDFVYIPYQKGFKLNIKTNEKVLKESILLTNKDKYIYSPVSGKVLGATHMVVNKEKIPSIVIENDFKETRGQITPAKRLINNYTKEEVNKLIKDFNAFESNLDGNIIVVNGFDLDIYESTRKYILYKYTSEILETIDAISDIFKCKSSFLAIKNNDSENAQKLINHIGTYPNINLRLLPDLYPLGYKSMLIDYINIKKTKKDNIMYLTVEDVLAIYNVLRRKRPITEKLVTVAGDSLEDQKVVNVKLGTTLDDLLINNFKIKDKDYKIVINGLLSGYEVDSLNMVITKDIRSIYIQAIDKSIEKDCINCGMCHTLCPVGADVRTGYKMDKCIKCGICSYVCPAKINFKSRWSNE